MQRLRIVLIIRISDIHRFVGQFDAYLTGMVLHKSLLRHDIPHPDQIFLVVVAHLQIAGTDAWWAHHHEEAVVHGFLSDFQIERREERLQTLGIELFDISLTRGT